MHHIIKKKHLTLANNFFVVGLSYKNADIETRSQFSLSDLQLHALMLEAKEIQLNEMLVITTCNRTELYGWAKSEEPLIQLLCNHAVGDRALFDQVGFTFRGKEAFNHIFRVGTGLESQILGDFEVIGQLKQSFYHSKRLGLINGRSERLVNAVIQSSKRIKTETQISSGATSVAFAS
ncbi:glutamyl-tRNA reductase, partial [Flavobacteriaceae bacterium]|nr:glutamyl-tRNA reductase [Flavobacteriaceae bacterium]